MRTSGVLPDAFTCSFLLKACVSLLDIANGKILHGVVEKLGFGSNLFLQNMILNLYGLCGEMADAMLLFDKMPQRDVVTWNTVITQMLKRGDIEGASRLFSRLEEESGLRPNQVTVVSVLAACADLCALDLGKRVHEYSNRSGFKNNVLVCNTLIDMYAKCGSLEEASRVFDEMEGKRTVFSWSAMIVGLAAHGRAQEALSLFSSMLQDGTEPNGVTFVGLLHACAHMGLVDEGRAFFTSMTRDYGITPGIEHYGCMVDLLSRAGLVKEAYEFIMEMPIKPNGIIWGALLGGCRLHKDIKLAEQAIQHLSVLDPLNDGYYIVLSNIYAEAGRWEDVTRVRKLMKARGVKKTSGWSKITLDDGIVHEFVAGDESHPQAEGIFRKWDELVVEMMLRGYVANTSLVLLDIEEEQKVKFIYRHSEKLAVSFGLLNTPAGTTIRIIKNLRVCEDCHSALKLIAAISGREIVVRDRNRFHCFKDGCCSCGDYW
ncbi:unnamed protein product [Linum tenue]|uniref:DYW domain-containing protein n=1 Tax=Linum tenue TaxID=586396 RepID=A0AAV0GZP9_9ROSI|nr:unnamed protein product [Linum tenue]